MRTIYKYQLNAGVKELNLPENAIVVDFNVQGDKFYLWAEIDTTPETHVRRIFEIYGTGEPINTSHSYIKTCHVNGYVFHLYELTNY